MRGGLKNSVQDFAILGGTPCFDTKILRNRQFSPSWSAYEAAMRDIFARQYYTNQGPLVRQLENDLQAFCKVKHAICVTNGMIGLMMVAEAMRLKGKVIVPVFTHIATIEAMLWVGLTPVLCDVDPQSKLMSAALVEPLISDDVVAILAVNLWGQVCDVNALEHLAHRYGKAFILDSAQAFGCQFNGRTIGGNGLAEVFSFSTPSILDANQGGCITTNDDVLAAKLRNIRSSYGAGKPVEVVKTSNGRMSEAQAALALLALSGLDHRIRHQAALYRMYQTFLSGTPGLKLIELTEQSNYQSVICEIDTHQFGLDRDGLVKILQAENIDAGEGYQWLCSDHLEQYGISLPQDTTVIQDCNRLLTLPIGKYMNENDVQKISQIIKQIQASHRSFNFGEGH